MCLHVDDLRLRLGDCGGCLDGGDVVASVVVIIVVVAVVAVVAKDIGRSQGACSKESWC